MMQQYPLKRAQVHDSKANISVFCLILFANYGRLNDDIHRYGDLVLDRFANQFTLFANGRCRLPPIDNAEESMNLLPLISWTLAVVTVALSAGAAKEFINGHVEKATRLREERAIRAAVLSAASRVSNQSDKTLARRDFRDRAAGKALGLLAI